MDSNKLRRLAGIPIDLSIPANAKGTVRHPANLIAEHAKVPQHRGDLAPKTKDNMRARVNHAKKAVEALEQARDELMDLPAIDYMEDIPTLIKQLHQILHGDDGTGGIHQLHRKYKGDFDNTIFPEDMEEEKRKEEEEQQAQDAGITGNEPDASKKKKTNEAVDTVGVIKQKVDPSKENKKPFKLADGSTPTEKSMVVDPKAAKEVEEDPADNTPVDDKVLETEDHTCPECGAAYKAEKVGESTEYHATCNCDINKDNVHEASGPLFARDAEHPKHGNEEGYQSWGDSKKPANVVSSEDGPSLYYPDGAKRENANQLSTNPYNENQKVNVPAKIKSALKAEADVARKLAETFTMRKDWDSKNFHETLANAMDTLNQFLEKGTIYGIKEAQVFMTSLMSPFTNKLPSDVIKYVASGGSLRSLRSYVNDVKAPHTGTVFQQDSDGTK